MKIVSTSELAKNNMIAGLCLSKLIGKLKKLEKSEALIMSNEEWAFKTTPHAYTTNLSRRVGKDIVIRKLKKDQGWAFYHKDENL